MREAPAVEVEGIGLKLEVVKAGVYVALKVRLLVSLLNDLEVNSLTWTQHSSYRIQRGWLLYSWNFLIVSSAAISKILTGLYLLEESTTTLGIEFPYP
jgi:hypothetical protein